MDQADDDVTALLAGQGRFRRIIGIDLVDRLAGDGEIRRLQAAGINGLGIMKGYSRYAFAVTIDRTQGRHVADRRWSRCRRCRRRHGRLIQASTAGAAQTGAVRLRAQQSTARAGICLPFMKRSPRIEIFLQFIIPRLVRLPVAVVTQFCEKASGT